MNNGMITLGYCFIVPHVAYAYIHDDGCLLLMLCYSCLNSGCYCFITLAVSCILVVVVLLLRLLIVLLLLDLLFYVY